MKNTIKREGLLVLRLPSSVFPSIILILIAFVFASVFLSGSVSAVDWVESFNGNSPGSDVVSTGAWTEAQASPSCDDDLYWVSGGIFEVETYNCEMIYFYNGGMTWTNYEVVVPQLYSGDDLSGGSGVGVAFRVQDGNNFYYAVIYDSPSGDEIQVGKCIPGSCSPIPGGTTSFTVNSYTNYEFKISVIGDRIKVYVDGNLEVDVTDNSIFTDGTVGIFTGGDTVYLASWDEFQVTFDSSCWDAGPAIHPICSCNDLQNIETQLSWDYELQNDIDCSATTGWDGGAGFVPIGCSIGSCGSRPVLQYFTGNFDGQGFNVTGLYINRPSEDCVALFGSIDSGSGISNVGLIDADIIGDGYTGGLIGYINVNAATVNISNSYSTGTVVGGSWVGGLVGVNEGDIYNSYSKADVSGNTNVGGLVGNTYYGTITNSYSTGSVTGNSDFGGLVGWANVSSCSSSFWDNETSGQSTSACGTGKTAADMKKQSTFTTWHFTTVCRIVEDVSYPCLFWEVGCETPAAFEDIGLRSFDGTAIVSIAAERLWALTSPLRIFKNGDKYGVVLVDPLDPAATNIRIQTSSGIMALRNYSFPPTAAVSGCGILDQPNTIYFLTDTIINNELSGPCIRITAPNVILDCQGYDNYIKSDDAVAGVYSNQLNTEIRNCNISMADGTSPDFGYGILLYGANNSHIHDNLFPGTTIGNGEDYHIYLFGTYDTIIEDNAMRFADWCGVELEYSSRNIIRNNNLTENYEGIYLSTEANDNLIQGNVFDNNWLNILLWGWNWNNTIINPVFIIGDWTGYSIFCQATHSNTFTNIIVDGSAGWGEGVHLGRESNNNVLRNVLASNHYENGIVLDSSSNNTLINVTANNNEEYGILLDVSVEDSFNNTLIDVTANNNYYSGIAIYESLNTTLTNVAANNNDEYGVEIGGLNIDLTNAIVNDNTYDGIMVWNSADDVFLTNVTANSNDESGIYVYAIPSVDITDSHFCYNILTDADCLSAQTFVNNQCDTVSLCGVCSSPC
jgi:parallel beta-helix repeat protein